MGETAKVLCPDKKVLVPDLNAGCSLADSCQAEAFARFVSEHPDHTVISYVNTTAAVKAVTDVVVTSTNARQIVENFPHEEKIIFGPDRNLGSYINAVTGREMLLWNGACHVHEQFSVQKIVELKQQYPDAVVLGCTHFSHLKREIADLLPEAKIIDAAACAAAGAAARLSGVGRGEERFFVTGDPVRFAKRASLLLRRPVTAEKIIP